MKQLLRVAVGVAGILGLLMALRIWIAPAAVAAQFGLAAPGGLGIATIRADLAGFFAVAGGLALAAAALDRAALLTAPLLLMAAALCGRAVTLAVQGPASEMFTPMAVEAVLLALFGAGLWRLGPQRGG